MTSRRTAVAVAVAALGLVAGCGRAPEAAGALGSATASPAAPPPVLRLFERDSQQATVDLGAPGAGPGDQFVFSGDLFDGSATGSKVGRADGSCATTSGSPTSPGTLVCQITIALHDGQIETQASFDSGPFFAGTTLPIAVIGGTGRYRQEHGDGTAVIPDPADPSAVLFTLDIGP